MNSFDCKFKSANGLTKLTGKNYISLNSVQEFINPFFPNAPFLYPLKTSEKIMVYWCFQGVEKGCIGNE